MKNTFLSILMIFSTLIVTSSASASSGWIIYHESAFKGKVIDAETKEPIGGVVVAAIYHVRKYGIGAGIMSDSLAVDAKEVLTNGKGEFHIPSHTFLSFWPFAGGETTRFIIFKPGYDIAEGPEYVRLPNGSLAGSDYPMKAEAFKKGTTVELMRLKSREEIVKRMMGIPSDFGHKELPLLYKAMDEEQKLFLLDKGK